MHIPAIFIYLLAGGFVVSAIGTFFYLRLARHHGIFAIPNTRSLHHSKTTHGGGIVFATVFLAGQAILFLLGYIPLNAFIALAGGGAVITAVGFWDDMYGVSARLRFAAHVGLCALILVCFGGFPPLPVGETVINLGWAGHILALLGLVWLINLYNFMDGIDGMAAAGAVFFALAAAAIMLIWTGPAPEALVAVFLAATVAGFLPFNWPPAALFMGDSGSTFLGYIFGALMVMTMTAGTMSLWNWVIILGCFIADTGTTLALRIWMIDKWYQVAHRSHAYQNLARVRKSHRMVAGGVVLINIFWLLPMALWSMYRPDIALIIAVIALLPLVGISLKYGPLYSSA